MQSDIERYTERLEWWVESAASWKRIAELDRAVGGNAQVALQGRKHALKAASYNRMKLQWANEKAWLASVAKK
jgi:hypothetical protein